MRIIALHALSIAISVQLFLWNLDAGTAWYYPAGCAALAVVSATRIRRVLDAPPRSRNSRCGAQKVLVDGVSAFVCTGRQNHPGKHHEGRIEWDEADGYEYLGHRRGAR